MTRVILYTGKGGVGKTSISAATALRASQNGMRTIVLSTDSAHSLGDSLDMQLGPEPKKIVDNLWAQETDVYYNMEKYWGTVQRWMESILAWEGFAPILADEMVVLPGMDELANLLWILEHHRTNKYDLIVVDCAPTAETFRLLSFPEAGRWWLEKIFPLSRKISGLARPILRRVSSMPLPSTEVFDTTADLMEQIENIQLVLSDPEQTSVRLVTNPERMVIKETQRAFTQLGLYGYRADLVICNRVLPDEVIASGYFSEQGAKQKKHLETLHEIFGEIPIKITPQFDHELVGIESLEKLATILFDDENPATFFHDELPFVIFTRDQNEDEFVDGPVDSESLMKLKIPLVDRDQIRLTQAAEELIIEVDQYRRNMLLPRALQQPAVLSAKLDQNILNIWFGEKNNG